MANLKVFVSSTCYDLSVVRSQLRVFIMGFGHEPVMSDYSDVLYDPRIHTHASCIQEIDNCDVVILIIGSRFGGKSIPKALDMVDFDLMMSSSASNVDVKENKDNLSITQLEIMRAIQSGLPIYAFIDNRVHHDHLVYERNKDNHDVISKINFPSIDSQETAKYIFEFINFLRLRTENNSISPFSKMEDIEVFLRKQWSGLLQRLLHEQRTQKLEDRRTDTILNEIADMRAAIMTSIASDELKETAKGAIKFRRLIEFICSINTQDAMSIAQWDMPWYDVLKQIGIVHVEPSQERDKSPALFGSVIEISDGTVYGARVSYRSIMQDFSLQWSEFSALNKGSREAIVNAVLDNSSAGNSLRMMLHRLGTTKSDDSPGEIAREESEN